MSAVPTENELHRVAVTGIIWKEEDGVRRYLITKRSPHKKAWPGKWTVPGGGMEATDYTNTEPSYANTESPQWYGALEKTLRREIREEVGLEVEDIRYLLDVAAIRPDGIPMLVLSMYCAYQSGEVTFDDDATEFAWITAAHAGEYDLIKGIDDEVRQVDAILGGA
jgi:8-oxo-dGTP pyrophosphatase MutT (NUDIX family)